MILPTARIEICLICLLLLSDGRLALGDELLMESPLSPIDSEIDIDQVSTTQRTPVISTSEPIEAQPQECGLTNLVATSSLQTLLSPQWPSATMLSIQCSWYISAPEGLRVELSFFSIEIAACCDSIVIEGIESDDGQRTVTLRSSTRDTFVSRTGGMLRITYNSYGLMPMRGFRANYIAKNPFAPTTAPVTTDTTTEPPLYTLPPGRRRSCGGTGKRVLVGQYYFLQSPYRYSRECRWRLFAPQNFLVKLVFIDFNVVPDSATFELLEVKRPKVDWDTAKVLLQLSEDRTGFEYTFDSNLGGIRYRSDNDDSSFMILYYAVPASCGSEVTASNTIKNIQSPSYPKLLYKGELNCTWSIRSQVKGAKIYLVFTTLETTQGKDSLKVYDGEALVPESELIENQVYVSNTDQLKVVFTSVEHYGLKGFQASYYTDEVATTTPAITQRLPRRPNTCGKVLRRVNLGQKLILRSPRREKNCRWRLQTDKGVSIKLTFLEYELDPAQASLKLVDIRGFRFQWDTLPVLLDESNITVGRVFHYPRNIGGIIYESGTKDSLVSIQYEAYLPKGGCGFTDFASNKWRQLKSPGFPRRYQEKMDCTWTIRARGARRIELIVGDIQVASGDKVQIYDGSVLVYEYSSVIFGDVPDIRKEFISSARRGFTIRFIAQAGDEISGFSARYRYARARRGGTMTTSSTPSTDTTTQVTARSTMASTTEIQTTSSERTEPTQSSTMVTEITTAFSQALNRTSAKESLKCFQIMIAGVPGNGTVLNMNRTQSCPDESVCFFANITSSVEIEGYDGKNTMTTLYGACLPKAAKGAYGCNEIFDSISSATTVVPNADIRVESCGYKYCETDLCNDNRDLQISTSYTPVNKSSVGEPLRCFAITKTILPEYGTITSNTRSVIQCPANSKCQLTFVKSKVSTAGTTVNVEVTQGNCVPEFQCSMDLCSQLDDVAPMVGTDATFTDCQSSCCVGNLCNDDIIQSTASAMITPTNEMITTGTLQTSKTTTSEAPATQPDKADYLECYSIQKAVLSMNGTPVTNFKNVTACDQGSKCAVAVASATVQMSGSSTDVEATYGFCLPSLSCNENVCDYLDPAASMQGVDMKFTSCRAACCDGNLCNDPSILLTETLTSESPETTPQSTTISTTPELPSTEEEITEAISQTEAITSPLATLPTTAITEPSDPLQCYSKSKVVTATGLVVVDISEVIICPANSKCISAEAKASIATFGFDMDVDANYGNCVAAELCSGDPCNTILSSAFDQVLDVTVNSCVARCCDNNLCNGGPKPTSTIKDMQSTTTISTTPKLSSREEEITESISQTGAITSPLATLPTTAVADITEPSDPLRCYSISKVVTMTGLVVVDTSTVMTCPSNSKCIWAQLQATVTASGFDMDANVNYGHCVTAELCSGDPCAQLDQVYDTILNSCAATCCDNNLCNGGAKPTSTIKDTQSTTKSTTPKVTAATTAIIDRTTTALTTTSAEEISTLTCYSINKISSLTTGTISNNKTVDLCPAGSKCLLANVATKLDVSGLALQVQIVYGTCVPSLSCVANLCHILSPLVAGQGLSVEFDSCDAYCCDSDLCNNDVAPATPSASSTISTASKLPSTKEEITEALSQTEAITSALASLPTTAVTEPSDPLQCYSMSKVVTATGLVVVDISDVIICPSNSKCISAEAKASVATFGFDMDVDVNYGNCVTAGLCSGDPCDTILSSAFDQVLDVTVKSCAARCCNNNLCNGGPAPTSTIEDTQSTTKSTTPEVTAAITEATTGISTLTCYTINKISSLTTGIISNNKTVDTCPAGSRCLLANVATKLDVSGLALQVQIVYGTCVPSLSCVANLCDILSPLVARQGFSVEFDSCDAYCCDSDLCNNDVTTATPNASSVKPPSLTTAMVKTTQEITTVISAIVSSTRAILTTTASIEPTDSVKCYTLTRATSPLIGTVLVDTKSIQTCLPQFKCMLVEAKAKVDVQGFSVDVDVTYGSCLPAVSCNTNICDSVPPIGLEQGFSLNFISCDASCCDGDLCNDLPTLTTAIPSESPSLPKTVTPPSLTTAMIKTTKEITTMISAMVSSTRALESTTQASSTAESGPSIVTTTASIEPTDSVESLKCYTLTRATTPQMGTVLINSKSVQTCPLQSKCMLVDAKAYFDVPSFSVDVDVTYGSCLPAVSCNTNICDHVPLDDLAQELSINFISCNASCCDGDLCNDLPTQTTAVPSASPSLPTTVTPPSLTTAMIKTTKEITTLISAMVSSSPESTTAESAISQTTEDSVASLRCYTLTRVTSPLIGTVLVDTKSVQTCLPQFKCMLVDAKAKVEVQGFSVDVEVSYGSCLPAVSCNTNICDSVPPIGIEQGLSLNFISCDASCCEADLCNDLPTQTTAIPSASPSLPTTGTTAQPPVGTDESTTGSKDSLKCYVINKVTNPLTGTLISDTKTIMTCPENSACLLADADASMSAAGFEMNVVIQYGLCVTALSCGGNLCEGLSSQVIMGDTGFIIGSCKATCCSEDLCNEGSTMPGSSMLTPTVPDVTEEDITESPIIVTTEIDIADRNLSKEDFRNLFGYTTESPTGIEKDATSESYTQATVLNATFTSISRDILTTVASLMSNTTDSKPTSESSAGVATEGPEARCYNIRKSVFLETSTTVEDLKTEVTCGDLTRCMFMNATAQTAIDGTTVNLLVNYGECVSEKSCQGDTCDYLFRAGVGAELSMTLTSCSAYCCEGDLCNDGPRSTGNISLPTETTTSVITESQYMPTTSDGVKDIIPTTTASPVIDGVLRCYAIDNMTMLDLNIVVVDEREPRECEAGTRCVLIKSNGILNGNIQVQSFYGACVDESDCVGDPCTTFSEQIRQSGRLVEYTTCSSQCCDTDLCNDFIPEPVTAQPDATQTVPSSPTVSAGPSCFTSMEIIIHPFERPVITTTGRKSCQQQEQCMFVTADYISQDNESITINYGDCAEESICRNRLCDDQLKNIAAIGDEMFLQNCNISCCENDFCNEKEKLGIERVAKPTTVPIISASETTTGGARALGPQLSCFKIDRNVIGGEVSSDTVQMVQCPPGSKCTYYSTTTELFGLKVENTFASCVPEMLCSVNPCTGITQLFSMNSATKCLSYCCSEDFCNGQNRTEDTSTPSPDDGDIKPGLQCYQMDKTTPAVLFGADLSEEKIVTCPGSSKCSYTKSVVDIFGVEVTTETASCKVESLCDDSFCEGLTNALSCTTYCCDSDLCNKANETLTEPTISSPTPITTTPEAGTTAAAPGPQLQCYNVRQIKSAGKTFDEAIILQNCSALDTGCVLVKTVLEGERFFIPQLEVISGGCTTAEYCGIESCDVVKRLVPELPGLTFKLSQCQAACCADSKCNNLDSEQIWQQKLIEDDPAPGTTAPTLPRPVRCYSTDITIIGGSEVESKRDEIECAPDSVCALIRMTAYIGGVESNTVIGTCYSRSAARTSSCGKVVEDFKQRYGNDTDLPAIIEECQLALCEGDLCNDETLSADKTDPRFYFLRPT